MSANHKNNSILTSSTFNSSKGPQNILPIKQLEIQPNIIELYFITIGIYFRLPNALFVYSSIMLTLIKDKILPLFMEQSIMSRLKLILSMFMWRKVLNCCISYFWFLQICWEKKISLLTFSDNCYYIGLTNFNLECC